MRTTDPRVAMLEGRRRSLRWTGREWRSSAWVKVCFALAAFAVVLVGANWLMERTTGTFWADAKIGECIETKYLLRPFAAAGTGAPNPTVPCDDARAKWVINAHFMDPADGGRTVDCPNGDKDVQLPGLIRTTTWNIRSPNRDDLYGWGKMCAAPILHVGTCYAAGSDRGMTVTPASAETCTTYAEMYWKVTQRIDGVSDISRCSPATGLVLIEPAVTYCEDLVPLPPGVNRVLPPNPPPAG